jgi:hypothetical protein
MGGAKHAVNLPFGGKRDWADCRRGSVVGCFNDFVAGKIQHATVKSLKADADLLLSDSRGHERFRRFSLYWG